MTEVEMEMDQIDVKQPDNNVRSGAALAVDLQRRFSFAALNELVCFREIVSMCIADKQRKYIHQSRQR